MRGTLNIRKLDQDIIADTGVYDVTFSQDGEVADWPRLRRFSSEQELWEFLKDVGKDPQSVRELVEQVKSTGHAEVKDAEITGQQFRSFGLWEDTEAA